MKKLQSVLMIAAVLAIGSVAMAQDSVSAAGQGDALSPWLTTSQVTDYVIDLAPLTTTWGTEFGIAPLLKSSLTSSSYNSSLISAQATSVGVVTGQELVADSYFWWDEAGYGVNTGANFTPTTSFDTSSQIGTQFGAIYSEYATTDQSTDYAGFISAVGSYRPSDPGRLFVRRVVAATNGYTDSENRAQFGIGQVDANGNAHVRAENYGSTGPDSLLGNNIFRIKLPNRAVGALNVIDDNGCSDVGASDPTDDWIVVRSDSTYNTPSGIPENIAGRPVYIGSNFDSNFAYESTVGSASTTAAHRGASSDHRGAVYYSNTQVFSGSVGTACMLMKNADGATRTMGIWGVATNGAVSGTSQALDIPDTITDNDDSEVVDEINDSIHYYSQTAYRGANGQVALGKDQAGNIIVATTMPITAGGTTNPLECVAVARFNASDIGGTLEWTLASWLDTADIRGKLILDGPNGNILGQVSTLDEVTGGTDPGPSVSAPAIDSVGNVWFVSAVEMFDPNDDPQDPDHLNSNYGVGLIRAVYDAATFGYQLELVMVGGNIFPGQNSATDWLVSYIELADSNSISSGTFFSGNICQDAYNGIDTAGLDTADSRTLGGVVVAVGLSYDVDGDGDFRDYDDVPTGAEPYNTLVYIRGNGCGGDLSGDGKTDLSDLQALLASYGKSTGDAGFAPLADIDLSGTVDLSDLQLLLSSYGCGA